MNLATVWETTIDPAGTMESVLINVISLFKAYFNLFRGIPLYNMCVLCTVYMYITVFIQHVPYKNMGQFWQISNNEGDR